MGLIPKSLRMRSRHTRPTQISSPLDTVQMGNVQEKVRENVTYH